MKKEERRIAENFLMRRIFEEDEKFIDKTMERFSLARSTVYNYLTALCDAGEVERVGGSMPYRVCYHTARVTVDTSREDSEDRVFSRDIAPLLADLPENLQKIWRYAFSAMMSNALTHARASAVVCVVSRNRLFTMMGILDNGVGIFRRIAQAEKEQGGEILTPGEAASRLFAGKYTTAPETHAGEGIFFTSRLMDHFAIRSDAYLFTVNADTMGATGERFRGTAVQMGLANDSDKDLNGILSRYIDDAGDFSKTDLPIFCFFGGDTPLSRSEARRLLSVLGDFRAADLDFSGVTEVGRDFARELFARRAEEYPTLVLRVKNALPEVEKALCRAGYVETE